MVESTEILLGGAFIAAKFLLIYLTSQRYEKRDSVGVVSKIIIYPIKSCQGVQVSTCFVTKGGIRSGNLIDRSYMFIKADGSFITRAMNPKLANINVQVVENGLKLSAPEVNDLFLPFTPSPKAARLNVRIRTSRVVALDCGETAAEWTQKFLDLPGSRIVQAHPVLTRRRAYNFPYLKKYIILPHDDIYFHDQTAAHILSTASIDDINASMESSPVDERNFRPNILVSGVKASFDEDNWLKIFIRDTQMHGMWLNDRCKMTTIDPDSATFRLDKQPIQTLSKTRTKKGHGTPCVGICAGADIEGEFHVGDEVFAVRGNIP